MKQLIADYPDMKERLHIVEAVAALHVRFESIHPFIDGNGHCGRIPAQF